MSMTDPIADMLTRIRNALQAGHPAVNIPSSRLKADIAEILKAEGFLQDFDVRKEGPQGNLELKLRYDGDRKAIILGIERISRPGRRVYRGRDDLPKVLNGLGVAIISTSKGVMSDANARSNNVGGEVLCTVF